jgi:hypothetical protein
LNAQPGEEVALRDGVPSDPSIKTRLMFRRNIFLSVSFALQAAACALGRFHVKSLDDHDATRVQFDNVMKTRLAILMIAVVPGSPPGCGDKARRLSREYQTLALLHLLRGPQSEQLAVRSR